MESAFSETRHAAGLLQQFSGFSFCRNDVCFFPLSLFSATHRTRSCPAALFDLHGVFTALVRSTALRSVLALLLRRVSSPVMGIQLSRCFFGFVTVFFIDNPQSPC